jgi:cellulase/cellobiase CelA1
VKRTGPPVEGCAGWWVGVLRRLVRPRLRFGTAKIAANVVAYIANPAARGSATDSYTWAEVSGPDGPTLTAELHTGEGVRATAAIAAETTRRVLAGVEPGAWTTGQLFGAALVTDAIDAQVTVRAAISAWGPGGGPAEGAG